MEITGRITKDAAVHTLKDERAVVNFDIAISDGYKDKSGVWVDRTEFVQCAYWRNTGAAALLTKGTTVQLYGRISARAWHNAAGEAKAGLQFHTAAFKVIARSTKAGGTQDVHSTPSAEVPAENDDLPF
jgi:single-strand DNA-binding protein